MSPLLLALKKKEVDVSAHLDVATDWLWVAAAMVILFFILRPELWRRLWFERIDPRPAALTRITMGITVIWTFADLLVLQGEWLFTDQGLLLTEMARKNYGGKMRTLWDPEHGMQYWYDIFEILSDRWTVLFIRSDPPFVYTVFGLLFVCAFLMTIGWRTRIFTVLTWLLVLQVYNYNPIYFTGGDTVLRVFIFLSIFVDWGKAYSVDSWRRRRKQLLKKGAEGVPALPKIAAWPQRLFMLQLACIYCATGLLKSGKTWANGSALYYALNLDHFYRVPAHLVYAWAHVLGITRVMTVVVHWWEILFPLIFVGEMLRGWDKDVEQGTWQGPVPRWTLYALGLAGSVLAVWTAPTWARVTPLFVLAALIFIDRKWLGEPDKSGKGVVPWAIRALSFAAVVGFLIAGAMVADLSVLYYYKPPKGVPALFADVGRVRIMAAAATVAVPVTLTAVIFALRAWTPRVYRFVRDWLLGKRLWLTMGFLMHVGIDLTMNVGTFVQVMIAVYPIWLGGSDIDKMWRYLLWRPAKPGEGERPALPDARWKRVLRRLIAPGERARYRVKRPAWTVVHGPEEAEIRRVALLRCWDLGERLEFELDPKRKDKALLLRAPDKSTFEGGQAGRELISLFPGLWLMWPISMFPGVGALALAVLRQRR